MIEQILRIPPEFKLSDYRLCLLKDSCMYFTTALDSQTGTGWDKDLYEASPPNEYSRVWEKYSSIRYHAIPIKPKGRKFDIISIKYKIMLNGYISTSSIYDINRNREYFFKDKNNQGFKAGMGIKEAIDYIFKNDGEIMLYGIYRNYFEYKTMLLSL